VQHVRTQERAVQIDRKNGQIGAYPVFAAIGVDMLGGGHDVLGPDWGLVWVFRRRDVALPATP